MAKGKLVPLDLRAAVEEIQKRHEAGEPHRVLSREEIDEVRAMIEAVANFSPKADRLLTTEQVAESFGKTSQTIRNWAEQGKLVPAVIQDGRKWYTEQQIIDYKKRQMGVQQILIPDLRPQALILAVQDFMSIFDPERTVDVMIQTDENCRKVAFVVTSEDGLVSRTKTLKMED